LSRFPHTDFGWNGGRLGRWALDSWGVAHRQDDSLAIILGFLRVGGTFFFHAVFTICWALEGIR